MKLNQFYSIFISTILFVSCVCKNCTAEISPSLIASWQFENNYLDSGPNGYDGHGEGDPEFIDGPFGKCLYLSGADSVDTDSFYVGNSFSVSLFVNTTTTNDGQCFLGKHNEDGGINQFLLGYWSNGYNIWINGWPFTYGTKKTGWQHVALTVMANQEETESHIEIYINGEWLCSTDIGTVIGNCDTGKAWTIGQDWDGNTRTDFLVGYIDDIRLYDGVLTVEEIREIAGQFYVINEIWVDDDYTSIGRNDGHIWGLNAFDTIQGGINAALAGMKVNVASGTYYENITLKSGVILLGEDMNTTIIDANSQGRALYSNACSSDTIVDGFSIINGNGFNGGGMLNENNSQVNIRNCHFTLNTTTGHGAAIFNGNSNPTITDCEFVYNTSIHCAGAIHNENNSPATIRNCIFTGNTAPSNGGAIYNCYVSNSTITNCTFIDNTGGSGGAIANHANSDVIITSCRFINNIANSGGGLYNYDGSDAMVYNSEFINNSAVTDGGATTNWEGSNSTIANCTFAANTANAGSAIHNRNASVVTISNSIIWDNICNHLPIMNISDQYVTIEYCCVQDSGGSGLNWLCELGIDGSGNIDTDPFFVDINGMDDVFGTIDDDVSLSANSPCIDAGKNTDFPPEITTDLANATRFFDNIEVLDTGLGTVPIIDMGAYEYNVPMCGDINHPYPIGDVDKNCIVDLGDIALLSTHWLEDSRP